MALSVITLIGLMAAVGTTSSFVPQFIKTFRTRQTKDLSLLMYLILCTGVALWLIYGIFIVDWPLILANSVTLVLAMPILFLKVKNG
jgi:MtN3 and saliva related transmembrane protein